MRIQLALGIELAQQHPPHPLPGAILGPGLEAAPARRRRAIYAWHVCPGTAGLQPEEDAVERAAVVVPLPAGASFLRREQGLDDRPLRIREIMSAHTHNLAWAAPISKWLVDFILWLFDGRKHYVTFVDPKGIRNVEGPDDPRIRFYRTIKELEARLGDPNLILNSFIISNTPFQQVRWWTDDLSKEQFTNSQVLFQKDDHQTYIKRMLTAAIGEEQVAVEG